jgi:hypothetical protein
VRTGNRASVKPLTLIGLLVVSLVAACFGPSVPVPPPAPEAMSFALDAAAGTATYQASLGAAWGDCWVTVRVERTDDGVIVKSEADGRVAETEPFLANEGDETEVLLDCEDRAAGFCLVMHDGPSSTNFTCP